MSSDHGLLARWKLAFAAATDSRLAPTDRTVLMVILERMNETGVAWPSMVLIARDAKADRSSVVRSLRRLTDCGYLERESGDRTASNRYRMGRCNATPRREVAPRCKPAPGVGAKQHLSVGAALHPELASLNLPIEPDQETLVPAERFSDFWAAYPRKEAKPKAEQQWKAKNLAHHADAILADVAARSASGGPWHGTDRKFILLPTTYLGGRRWEDEWSPKRSGGLLPREARSAQEIKAVNEQTLARVGDSHGR